MFPRWIARTTVAALAFLLLFSCSKKGGGDDEDDGNGPYNILDLHVTAVSDSSVTLAWTATGDDADQGAAATYDIRYRLNGITGDTWEEAAQVVGEPSPKVAGTAETFEVLGLDHDSTYFFGLLACDEAGNCPYPSFCGPAVCFDNVVITFPDPHLELVIRTNVHKPTGELRRMDVMSLQYLDANSQQIDSLTGIGQCQNIFVAFLSGNYISDLAPLTALPRLRHLQVGANHLTDISPVAEMPYLISLVLRVNELSDLSPLSASHDLHLLDLTDCKVVDLNPLIINSAFAETDTLWLTHNPLSQEAINTQIPTLEARGVTVFH